MMLHVDVCCQLMTKVVTSCSGLLQVSCSEMVVVVGGLVMWCDVICCYMWMYVIICHCQLHCAADCCHLLMSSGAIGHHMWLCVVV